MAPATAARFDRRTAPAEWRATRSEWRGANPDWNHAAPWRGGHDWWRGRSEFNGYEGARNGFWFAPGFGYFAVSAVYWGMHWNVGQALPNEFWRYRVSDWQAYNLPPPPYGCAWVWLNGGVALIDMTDGYILDVEYGIY